MPPTTGFYLIKLNLQQRIQANRNSSRYGEFHQVIRPQKEHHNQSSFLFLPSFFPHFTTKFFPSSRPKTRGSWSQMRPHESWSPKDCFQFWRRAQEHMSSFKHLQFSSINSLFHPLRNSYEWMQPGGMWGLIRVLSSTLWWLPLCTMPMPKWCPAARIWPASNMMELAPPVWLTVNRCQWIRCKTISFPCIKTAPFTVFSVYEVLARWSRRNKEDTRMISWVHWTNGSRASWSSGSPHARESHSSRIGLLMVWMETMAATLSLRVA